MNARDLRDFGVDVDRSRALARLIPEGSLRVARIGDASPEDASTLRAAGYRGFLVGEALATAADPEKRIREFAAAIAKTPGGAG